MHMCGHAEVWPMTLKYLHKHVLRMTFSSITKFVIISKVISSNSPISSHPQSPFRFP